MTEAPRGGAGNHDPAHHNITAPSEINRSRLERERRGHEAFARTRRRAYVENPNVLARIDQYVIDDSVEDGTGDGLREGAASSERLIYPLVITGDPGSGKSALLAHWSARFHVDHPGIPVISHFVGAGTFGSEMTAMLHHVMHDLREQLAIPEEPTENAEELANQFLSWMTWLRRRRVVIIVDALNQIRQGVSPSELLGWVPPQLPPTVRILLSTLEGPILDEVRSRHWNELRVEPLSEAERREVARRFIGGEERFSTLRTQQIQKVAGSQRSANPLFLRTSLEEIRLLNSQQHHGAQAEEYLDADNLLTLFDRILARIESEFNPQMVSTVLRMIEASRNGLSAEEMIAICGARQVWINRFLAALDYQLICRDGLYTFFHDHLRQAVRSRYASTNQSQKAAYRRLGTWFRSLPAGERRAGEELHAWISAGKFDELQTSLCDPELFLWLWHNGHRYEIIRYWKDIRNEKAITIEEAYAPVIDRLVEEGEEEIGKAIEICEIAGRLAIDMSEYQEAERLLRRGLELRERPAEESERTIGLSLHLGITVREQGRLKEAEQILESLIAPAGELFGQQSSVTGQILDALATVYYMSHEFDRALAIHEQAYEILRSQVGDNHLDTVNALINVIACHHKLQELDVADRMYSDLIVRCEEIFGSDHAIVALVLHNHAINCQSMENYPKMRDLLQRAYEITLNIYGEDHIEAGSRLLGLAASERILGRYEEARSTLREVIRIYSRALGPEHPRVIIALNNMATAYSAEGKYRESEEYCRKVLEIRQRTLPPDHTLLLETKLNLSNTLFRQERWEDALEYMREPTRVMYDRLGPDNKWSKIWRERYTLTLRALGLEDEIRELEELWGT